MKIITQPELQEILAKQDFDSFTITCFDFLQALDADGAGELQTPNTVDNFTRVFKEVDRRL